MCRSFRVRSALNARENRRRGKQVLTIQRHWQQWKHKTHDEDKQHNKHNTESYNDEQHGPDQTLGVYPLAREG